MEQQLIQQQIFEIRGHRGITIRDTPGYNFGVNMPFAFTEQGVAMLSSVLRSNPINHVIRLDTFLQKNNVLSLQYGKE